MKLFAAIMPLVVALLFIPLQLLAICTVEEDPSCLDGGNYNPNNSISPYPPQNLSDLDAETNKAMRDIKGSSREQQQSEDAEQSFERSLESDFSNIGDPQ